jgi:hypothetical protein
MPSNAATSVYIDDRCSIIGALGNISSAASGVYGWVLQQEQSIGASSGGDFFMDCSLNIPGFLVLN